MSNTRNSAIFKRPRLSVETLEVRDTPALFGVGWNDRHVTVSEVPDGTAVDGVNSNLFSALGADGLSAAQIQNEVSRALAMWSTPANLNFGFVADTGAPLGAAGLSQGDARFGDIRIYGRPLDSNVLAITTPPSALVETRAGDIVLNTNFHFSVGAAPGKFDLFTTLLQETGHAIGIGNSTATDSAMYETYGGVRTAISSGDAASVVGLYGIRVDPAGTGDNNSLNKAFALTSSPATSTLYIKGDIGTSTDLDYYKFTTPAAIPQGVTVNVRTAGLSLLVPRVEIQDGKGNTLASASGVPGQDISLTLPAAAKTTYYVVVRGPAIQAGTDPLTATFTPGATGAYKVSAIFDSAATDPATLDSTVSTTTAANTTLAKAVTLPAVSTPTTLANYSVSALVSSGASGYFKFVSPDFDDKKTSVALLAIVRGPGNGVVPKIEIYDKDGKLINAEFVTGDGEDSTTLQVRGLAKKTTYFVKISTDGAPVNYQLDADFRTVTVDYTKVESKTITAAEGPVFRSLYIARAQVISYSLSTTALGANSPSATTVTIYDMAGQALSSWNTKIGTSAARAVLLMPGEYVMVIDGHMTAGSTAVTYNLSLMTLTDPIGINPVDPNNPTTLAPPPPAVPMPTPDTTVIAPPPPIGSPSPDFTFVIRTVSYFAWMMPMM
ncbi:matrixin family metalloprotease [Zavarzinella formosa]|uniref:matrixin family metalloprotease n=1 Tax=Zavarzinella formosa TaxID=360055 RepID=UPI0002F097FC|nr:matrixin family metalloprotease [Zavarzinella formosa]